MTHPITPATDPVTPAPVTSIDMTPTFAETARILIVLLENGTAEGRQYARDELIRWGQMLDRAKALQDLLK
jgi:hypothetical protein